MLQQIKQGKPDKRVSIDEFFDALDEDINEFNKATFGE